MVIDSSHDSNSDSVYCQNLLLTNSYCLTEAIIIINKISERNITMILSSILATTNREDEWKYRRVTDTIQVSNKLQVVCSCWCNNTTACHVKLNINLILSPF